MSEPDEANKAKRRRRRRSLRVPVDEVPRPTQAVAESVEVPLEAEGGMTVEMPAYSDDASPSLAGPPTIDGDSANEFDEPRTIVEAEGAAAEGPRQRQHQHRRQCRRPPDEAGAAEGGVTVATQPSRCVAGSKQPTKRRRTDRHRIPHRRSLAGGNHLSGRWSSCRKPTQTSRN